MPVTSNQKPVAGGIENQGSRIEYRASSFQQPVPIIAAVLKKGDGIPILSDDSLTIG